MSTLTIQVDFGPATLDAVNRLADALSASTKAEAPSTGGGARRGGRKPKPAESAPPAGDPPAAPAGDPPAAPAGESEGPTATEVRDTLKEFAGTFGRPEAVDLLSEFGNATNITTLDAEHYPAVLAKMKAKLAEKAGE